MRTFTALAALAATLSSPLAAVAAAPSIPFEKYRLGNGLEVILAQDRSLPLVAVDIWYHVGAADEEPGRTGFAHLFEHMMFTGSKHIPRGLAEKLLEAAGGTNSNATTSFDRTNYFDTMPSNQLELALWTHADRMGYLLDSLDQAALANQQDVVRNERRQSIENQPYGIVDEAVFRALFPARHPYRPVVMGSHTDIQSAKLADVRDFFKRYYRPNNATLVIAGDFDTSNAKRLVQKYFGSFRRGPDVARQVVVTPPITSERRVTVTDQIELERIDLAWLTPPKFKPDDAELTIAGFILGGGKSSRLYNKLVYDLQVAQEVSAGQDSNALTSVFEIEALARQGHTAAELQPIIDAEIDRLAAEGPTQDEVERAHNQIERALYAQLQRVGGRADVLNSYNQYTGDPGYLSKDIERYTRVTPADVQRAVREHLSKNARAVVLAVRGEKKLDPDPPAPPPPTAKDTESINSDEPWRKTPPKAAQARTPTLPAPQSFRLANGLTVLHLYRPSLPIATVRLIVNAGLASSDPALPGLADFAAVLLEEGTTSRTSRQLADQLAQLGAVYGAQTRRDVTALHVDGLSRNFADGLALLADIAQHPTFPRDEIERQRKALLNEIAEAREHGGAVADAALARALYGPANPYGRTALGTEASVARIGEGDLRGWWQRWFRPGNAALIVVGDIDTPSLRAMVDKQWGGWSATDVSSPSSARAPVVTTKARVVIVDKPDAPQTELRVGRIGAARTTPEYPALQVLNEALGGAFSSRINLNLREDKGYTYGAASRFEYGRAPGPFAVRTAVRADASGPAIKEILGEFRRAESAPFTASELARARGSLEQSLPGLFETNGAIAASFGELFAYGLPLDYYRTLPAAFSRVDAATVEKLSRRYLDPASMVVIAVGDRKRIEDDLKPLDLDPSEVWPIAGTLF